MTKKLQELFDLADTPDEDQNTELPENTREITQEALSNIEKIDQALPQVRGLELNDIEMDEIAAMAINSYKDLQDLGMQVDSRFSSEIFAVAATMLGHAITAKTAKANKKLKMVELQLKKLALDQKSADREKELDAIPVGEGTAFDRNELLKMLTSRAQANAESSTNKSKR